MPEVQIKDPRNLEITQNSKLKTQSLNPLRELYKLGQSPWYDNIERKLFKSGEFALLINEYGITGVTSNPTIFEKAITNSADYDVQVKDLLKANKDSHQIYDELTIEDVAVAADMLLDIYKNTHHIDGYVSIEVLPEYAYDVKKTVEYAKRLFKRLNRKNILIKVPGTKEAIPAITELTYEGINVNATLLFSIGHYETVAGAYIEGLAKRLAENKSLEEVVSVASVFVSRIDTRIDKISDVKGKAAVANSKIIYQRFKEIFFGEGFDKLREKGANIQRVLWASTSAKNPDYRDVKYVEELIGPNSINTIPHQTVLAFYDHGVAIPTIENNIDEAREVLGRLQSSGIDVNAICEELQKEGVRAFSDSFTSLIASIERKMASLRGVPT